MGAILFLHLEEVALISVACQDSKSAELIHQHVWGMENGNQILGSWSVKVTLKKLGYMYYDIHIIIYVHTANCGPPSLPVSSYILPYISTLEGAKVTYICDRNQSLHKEMAICTKSGQWEPNSSRIYKEARDVSGTQYYFMHEP